ncbi:DUF2399 domain-containing protein [Listeria seeligeri]|uniref:DUF2399 domain-containing protein n=1 Tax=Listeria seeligeri TaxID=1640 RepID=UPI001888B645|nr:DUF2399 domain-containing protein [Listeria seeligeri]MBF2663976.1 DUF2399 domain-containing protein [Listeria seeligeri]
MEKNDLRKEAIQYFESRPSLKLFFEELEKKYQSFGEFRGTISKSKFDNVEIANLLDFVGIDTWEWKKKNSIKVTYFLNQYEKSKFEAIPLEEVVEAVLGRKLISKKQIIQQEKQSFHCFLDNIAEISAVFKKVKDGNLKSLYSWYLGDNEACLKAFRLVLKATENLPTRWTKLPVFSYEQTGDPHAFDTNNYVGQLFFMVLETKSIRIEQTAFSKVERANEIYAEFNLIKDDIMNFAAINSLIAFNQAGPMKLWQQASIDAVPWNVPVRQLVNIIGIRPNIGNKVFLIENSGVFSVLLDKFPMLPMVCTNGQFRYAIWLVLERLIDEDIEIYYSGDFDPEGVMIAAKLKERYPDKVRFLTMDLEAYNQSRPSVHIDEERCKKLRNNFVPAELQEVAEAIVSSGLAGYQEGIIKILFREIEMLGN